MYKDVTEMSNFFLTYKYERQDQYQLGLATWFKAQE